MTTAWNQSHIAAAVLALGAVALTSACNGAEQPPTTTTSTTSSTTPSASTTAPPTLAPAEKDLQDAAATIARFWAVFDDLAADPTKSLNLVATVARDQAAEQTRIRLGTYRARGWTQKGSAVVENPRATTKDGNGFTVTACVDVSTVDFVDKAGKSVVKAARPDRQKYTYAVAKAPQGFFVTVDTLKGTPC